MFRRMLLWAAYGAVLSLLAFLIAQWSDGASIDNASFRNWATVAAGGFLGGIVGSFITEFLGLNKWVSRRLSK